MKTPETKEEAIQALVDQDVAKWGESERAASRKQHAFRSYGLALNELANRLELALPPTTPIQYLWSLRAAAKKALTPQDRSWLRKGG